MIASVFNSVVAVFIVSDCGVVSFAESDNVDVFAGTQSIFKKLAVGFLFVFTGNIFSGVFIKEKV